MEVIVKKLFLLALTFCAILNSQVKAAKPCRVTHMMRPLPVKPAQFHHNFYPQQPIQIPHTSLLNYENCLILSGFLFSGLALFISRNNEKLILPDRLLVALSAFTLIIPINVSIFVSKIIINEIKNNWS